MAPKRVVDVLDAVSVARRMSRIQLAIEVLSHWADEQVHIASVIQAVTGGNGSGTDAAGKGNP